MERPLGMPSVYAKSDIHDGQPVVESGVLIYLIHPVPTKGYPLDEMRDDYRIAVDRIRVALRFAAAYGKRGGGAVASAGGLYAIGA